MLSFVEFEREMITECTAAGKAITRQKPGYKEGRPKQITPEVIKQIKKDDPEKNWGSAERRGTGIGILTLRKSFSNTTAQTSKEEFGFFSRFQYHLPRENCLIYP